MFDLPYPLSIKKKSVLFVPTQMKDSALFSDGLRQLFCLLSMKTNNHELSIVETMMLADTKLWKGLYSDS